MIEQGIYALLVAATGVSSVISDRLYPLVLPEDLVSANDALPASATYQLVSAIPDYTNDGATGLQRSRIRYTGIGSVYSDAASVAAAIRVVLENYAGTLADGTVVSNVLVANQSSTYSDDARLYFVAYDFLIFYAN